MSIKIALCENSNITVEKIITFLNKYSNEYRKIFDIIVFHNMADLLSSKDKFDIYGINIKLQSRQKSGYDIRKRYPEIDIVYYIDDINYVPPQHGFCPHSFLINGFDEERMSKLLDFIFIKKKKLYIIIDSPNGEIRKRAINLNYVDIEERSLCYHFCNSEKLYSKTLRQSFFKAIEGTMSNKDFYYFLSPSFLINLAQIYMMNSNSIVFTNGEKLYFPKTKYEELNNAWKNFLFK